MREFWTKSLQDHVVLDTVWLSRRVYAHIRELNAKHRPVKSISALFPILEELFSSILK